MPYARRKTTQTEWKNLRGATITTVSISCFYQGSNQIVHRTFFKHVFRTGSQTIPTKIRCWVSSDTHTFYKKLKKKKKHKQSFIETSQ